MACVKMRIADRSVLRLIKMWLEAPVIEVKEGRNTPPNGNPKGTPQGGVISPLLANIYLHWFDKLFHRHDGPAQWAKARLVRYTDDFVVLARYQGDRLTGWNLMNLGLEPLQSKGTRMLEIKRMQESRVLENCTHGLTRGAEENSAPTLPFSAVNPTAVSKLNELIH